MPDEKTTRTPLERYYDNQGTIMLLLMQDNEQRLWSVDEVARELGDHADAVDTLTHLHGAGLIHRMGEFVWATRAAIRADEIAI